MTKLTQVRSALRSYLDDLAAAVAMQRPTITTSVNVSQNAAFPAFGTISFCAAASPAAPELVVASVECAVRSARLSCHCDLSTGAGKILADGPSAEIDLASVGTDASPQLAPWLAQVQAFFAGDAITCAIAQLDVSLRET